MKICTLLNGLYVIGLSSYKAAGDNYDDMTPFLAEGEGQECEVQVKSVNRRDKESSIAIEQLTLNPIAMAVLAVLDVLAVLAVLAVL